MSKLGSRSVLVAALMALVAGCAAAPTEQATLPPSSGLSDVPPPLMPARELPENAVDNAVAKLDGIADELMKKSGIPGMAIAVVHGGKTVYAKGFGVKDVRTGQKVDPGTVFQLASMSKPLGATVVARQVGEHAIDWDTPVVSKLPWFALSDPVVTPMVTIGDMYSHRSGLPDHAGDKLEDLGYDRRHVLEQLRQLPLDQFRTSYAYTNFGLTAAAEAVAVGAGKSWEELSDQVLYQPLGMTSTSSRFDDFAARPNHAVGHIHVGGSYEPRYVRDPDPEAPAGGASASADDVAHWLAMMLGNGSYAGKQIVDPEALLPAVTPQSVSTRGTEPAMRSGLYGYGFNVSTTSGARVVLSHSGGFELGSATNFVILPSADVAIVVLTNATPAGVPEALTAQFGDLVQFGEVREDWYALYNAVFVQMEKPVGSLVGHQPLVHPAPAALPSSYAGSYHNNYWGPAMVSERDGELALSLGPRGDTFGLKHWDGDVFTFDLVTENAPPGTISKASFDGNKLTLEYFDDFGKGTFTR